MIVGHVVAALEILYISDMITEYNKCEITRTTRHIPNIHQVKSVLQCLKLTEYSLTLELDATFVFQNSKYSTQRNIQSQSREC